MTSSFSASLWALSAGAAVVSAVLIDRRGRVLAAAAARAAAFFSLAGLSLTSGPGPLLTLALGLCAIGEISLAFDVRTSAPIGLIAFLLGHAAYLVLFARLGGGAAVLRLEPVRLAGILAAVSTSVLIARTLLTRKIPVVGALLIYVAAAGGARLWLSRCRRRYGPR